MNFQDDPKFQSLAAWPHETLVKFAQEAYVRLKEQEEAIQQLRNDLRDAMKMVRESNK